jgi:cobalt-zinc-cadmium efflux system outer membrane protein
MHAEIPMARADVETAAHPLRPYLLLRLGRDGLAVYRIQPHQVSPDRWIRILLARAVERVLVAQYQDAVRLKVADLYTAFVDVQAAHIRNACAKKYEQEMHHLSYIVNRLARSGVVRPADSSRIAAQCTGAELQLKRTETELRKAKLVLANLLNIPDSEIDRLDTGGGIEVKLADAPSVGELTRIGLRHRPDLTAYRRGLFRAYVELLRAWAEQLADITVFDWPDRSGPPNPQDKGRATARRLGVLLSLPILRLNRGVIVRAEINVEQTRTELAKVERQVGLDIRQARLDFEQSQAEVRDYRAVILPEAEKARNDTFEQFRQGEVDTLTYLKAQNQFNEVVSRYSGALVRHRRNALALNTAVGDRVVISAAVP